MPFSKKTFQFLKQLKRNNRRDWFLEHKSEYLEHVRRPMEDFISQLQSELAGDFPDVSFHPKKSIFRIHRDTRFSHDKTPYKTNIAASFDLKGPKVDFERPGFYLSIAPGEIFAGAGLYMPTSSQLKLIRREIVRNSASLRAIVEAKGFKTRFKAIRGESLKKAPQGFTPDHPDIELLRLKQFYVLREYSEAQLLQPKKFLRQICDDFRAAGPFVKWLKRSTSELEFSLTARVAS